MGLFDMRIKFNEKSVHTYGLFSHMDPSGVISFHHYKLRKFGWFHNKQLNRWKGIWLESNDMHITKLVQFCTQVLPQFLVQGLLSDVHV